MFLAVMITGALLRLLVLPLGGTGDVTIWKVWSFAASYDVTGMYGVGGSPPNQQVVHWNGEAMTVDYPPIALYTLSLVGHAYTVWDPRFRESPALTVFVKLPGVISEIVLLGLVLSWGRRRYGDVAAMWTAAALWLNPALLMNGPVLGYLDPLLFVPLVVAVVAAWNGPPWLAGACAAIAVLTKAQAVFFMPVVLALAFRRGPHSWKALGECLAAAACVAALALLPFVLRGAWWNLVQSLGRLAAHDMISAQAANLWWIVTWMIRVADSVHDWGWHRALTQEVRILTISGAIAAGYPNVRVIGTLLVAAALGVAMWWSTRVRSLAEAAALAAWTAYAYTMLGAQVHENHVIAAIPVLAIAAGLDTRLRPVFWCVSVIAALNLYLFYGIVPNVEPIISLRVIIMDTTVVLSVINIGVFVWFTRLLMHRPVDGPPVSAAAAR